VDYDTIRWTEQASGWLGPYKPPFYIWQNGGWRGMETRKVRRSGAWV
jgi:hypothetical protein